MQKVTGVGGLFFKARDPKALMEWYGQHLGLQFNHGFVQLEWANDPKKETGSTLISVFKEDSAQFNPSDKPFMLNLRVADLRALMAELKEKGVKIVGEMEEHDYGRFGWILDLEGNKIELWEPPVE